MRVNAPVSCFMATWRRVFPVLLAAIGCLSGTGFSASADEVGPTPWHLIDFWWDLGVEEVLQDYSIDVTISGDIPEEVRLYIAPIGLAKISGMSFYGGLQTASDGFLEHPHRQRQYIGRGSIFSRWGTRTLDAVRRSLGGLYESGGYEGDFVSVRHPFPWKPGRYTYSVRRQAQGVEEGKPYTWLGAFVLDHQTGQEVYIGALRFEGQDLKMDRRAAGFVEIYGRRRPVEDIPQIAVSFGPWRLNGREIKPASITAYYPVKVPARAKARREGGVAVVDVGVEVDRAQLPECHRRGDMYVQALPEATP